MNDLIERLERHANSLRYTKWGDISDAIDEAIDALREAQKPAQPANASEASTPARLRELAEKAADNWAYWHERGEDAKGAVWVDFADALRAAADGWEQSRLVAQVNWGQVLELREKHAEMFATLAARDALLRRAVDTLESVEYEARHTLVSETLTEVSALAAEIAAALDKEKDNA